MEGEYFRVNDLEAFTLKVQELAFKIIEDYPEIITKKEYDGWLTDNNVFSERGNFETSTCKIQIRSSDTKEKIVTISTIEDKQIKVNVHVKMIRNKIIEMGITVPGNCYIATEKGWFKRITITFPS